MKGRAIGQIGETSAWAVQWPFASGAAALTCLLGYTFIVKL